MKKKALMILLATTMILTSCGKDSVQADMPETETNTVEQESNDETEIESSEDTLQESNPKEEFTEKETVQDAGKEPESEEMVTESETEIEPEEAKVPEEIKESEEIKKAETEKSPIENRNDKETKEPEPEVPKVEVPKAEEPKVEEPKAPEHVHSYSVASETAATCINEGTKTFKCSCGDSYTENIAKISHNYTTERKSVTCAENGYTKTYCISCGDVQSENVVTAPGHNLVEWWYSQPTCTYEGYMHSMKCTNCDYSEALPESGPLGHLADAGTVFRESTCVSQGIKEHQCVRCGATLDDERLPLDNTRHEWMTEDGITFCGNCYTIKE